MRHLGNLREDHAAVQHHVSWASVHLRPTAHSIALRYNPWRITSNTKFGAEDHPERRAFVHQRLKFFRISTRPDERPSVTGYRAVRAAASVASTAAKTRDEFAVGLSEEIRLADCKAIEILPIDKYEPITTHQNAQALCRSLKLIATYVSRVGIRCAFVASS
jgi:hypothetical protein